MAAPDVLFVHSGLQGALRLRGDTRGQKMDTLLDGLEAAVPEGVLAMPAFTYSFCAGEDFDVQGSPSTVGMLTEHFRGREGVRRTPEPLFSTAIRGRLPENWEERLFAVRDVDCFGPESIFAFLHESNAWLLFFGVGFEFCTFLYFVEQRLRVPYRYDKPFEGDVIVSGARHAVTASYHVRDLEAGVENDFRPLGRELVERGLASEMRLERGPRLLCCRAGDVHDVAVEKVRQAPDYLLARGHRGAPAA